MLDLDADAESDTDTGGCRHWSLLSQAICLDVFPVLDGLPETSIRRKRVLKGNGDPQRYQGPVCEKQCFAAESDQGAGGIRVEIDIARANIL